jgi:hypothetical protein
MDPIESDRFKTQCPHCALHFEVLNDYADQTITCPGCQGEYKAAPRLVTAEFLALSRDPRFTSRSAKIVSPRAKSGRIVQFLGIPAFFVVPPFGAMVGLAMVVTGAIMTKKHHCSNCGNPVADKKVKRCRICLIVFK